MTQMSKEYATAIFMLASEENCHEKVSESFDIMLQVFDENEAFIELLSSPAIPLSERLKLIDDAFCELFEYAVSLLKLLCEKMLAASFSDCVKEYKALLSDVKQVSYAKVTSAVALAEKEKETLIEKIQKMCKNTVTMETVVDSTILGGMIVEVDGKIIDASLRRRLNDIKDVISR